MVIKHSTAEQVARLVADVLGEDPVRREAATARLAVIGGRAVDRILTTLAATSTPTARAALLQVLERIGEPRALPAAEAALGSNEPGVAAAGTGVLRALLQASRSEVATQALELLTGVVLDRGRPDAVRAAALDALHDLSPEVVAPLVERLQDDPSSALRRMAGFPPGSASVAAPGAAEPVGAPSLEAMADGALPPDPEVMKTAVLAAAAAVALPVLHRLVVAVRAREDEAGPAGWTAWSAVRGTLHQALAARGSRVALYDLRETVEGSPERLSVGMIAALSAVGDRSCLEPLAAAIASVQDEWLRGQLSDAFDRICRRENLTRRHAVMKRLVARHPELVK